MMLRSLTDNSSDEELPENLAALEEVDERLELEDIEVMSNWQKGNITPRPVIFSGDSGVIRHPSVTTEAECFKLFITTSTIDLIVTETNSYAQSLRQQCNNAGKLAKWADTTGRVVCLFGCFFLPWVWLKKII